MKAIDRLVLLSLRVGVGVFVCGKEGVVNERLEEGAEGRRCGGRGRRKERKEGGQRKKEASMVRRQKGIEKKDDEGKK